MVGRAVVTQEQNSPASLPACHSLPGKALALDRASAAASSPDLSERVPVHARSDGQGDGHRQ